MSGLIAQWPLLAPVALGGLAIWLLLPHDGQRLRGVGALCGVVALVALLRHFFHPDVQTVQDSLFYLFGGGAIISGVMMITHTNPVYAALSFALVTLSTCGLFLLNAAPFLAAATVIVYAGAIVVTFLFVIMLAQQAGAAGYDRRAFQPELATIGGCVLLVGLLYTLQEWGAQPDDAVVRTSGGAAAVASAKFVRPPIDVDANPLSMPRKNMIGESDLGTLRGVGRSLFGDYLFAVELAGTVLLIATVGAIALAPRRSQGTL
jgi:NADH-quinone oxidoreductase subunit J